MSCAKSGCTAPNSGAVLSSKTSWKRRAGSIKSSPLSPIRKYHPRENPTPLARPGGCFKSQHLTDRRQLNCRRRFSAMRVNSSWNSHWSSAATCRPRSFFKPADIPFSHQLYLAKCTCLLPRGKNTLPTTMATPIRNSRGPNLGQVPLQRATKSKNSIEPTRRATLLCLEADSVTQQNPNLTTPHLKILVKDPTPPPTAHSKTHDAVLSPAGQKCPVTVLQALNTGPALQRHPTDLYLK